MNTSLDYVPFDEKAKSLQDSIKSQILCIDAMMRGSLKDSREKSLAITKLEEAFMWIGKAIKVDQEARNGERNGQD